MFDYDSIWDIYEMKFVIFFVSVVVTILLVNWFYKNNKDKD